MQKQFLRLLSFLAFLFLAGCASDQNIVNSLDERDANEIVVFLASKGIEAKKVAAPTSAVGGGSATSLFSIAVSSDRSVDAMAILNRAGLPRRSGTTLLELFAKSGLMSSTLEETIRYQAGLAEELRNTIQKIDGVIDANVQISFPPAQTTGTAAPGAVAPKITAAVYVKHQGILEDPNSHLEIKIKRLMAGSVNGLSYDDVAVISDRSKFTDIILTPSGEPIGPSALETHAGIWGMVMTENSVARFRVIFFFFLMLLFLVCGLAGWMIYRFYPQMRISLLAKKEPPPPGPNP